VSRCQRRLDLSERTTTRCHGTKADLLLHGTDYLLGTDQLLGTDPLFGTDDMLDEKQLEYRQSSIGG
jgi:hypothetical protein